jgi:putative molybdopterin biosynthesis protein
VKGAHSGHPAPEAAYAHWIDTCERAGWPGDTADAADTAAASETSEAAGTGDASRRAGHVPLASALGRVTSAPVTARWPSPRADCAAMDGIAINAGKSGISGGAGGDPGSSGPHRIAPGAFTWIDTGDLMPPGADTVIMREHVTIDSDGAALITGSPNTSVGHHVRVRGEDFAAGQVLVPAGRRLRPADLAVAAAAGLVTLPVAPAPVVAVIPTGDEIRSAGTEDLQPGDIIDSNSVYLAARCERAGATARVSDVIPDDPDRLAAEVRRAASGADLVLVIAGSSRGRGDHTAAVLAQVGGVAVAGVAVRPGHPALLGHVKAAADRTVPVVGLPGYPIATAVVFELFAAPLLVALQGEETPERTRPARLACEWTSSPEIEEWAPVSLSPDGVATPTGHGAGSTSKLACADAWWRIPVGAGHFPGGTEITVIPWR